jgi:hypothetical protein
LAGGSNIHLWWNSLGSHCNGISEELISPVVCWVCVTRTALAWIFLYKQTYH